MLYVEDNFPSRCRRPKPRSNFFVVRFMQETEFIKMNMKKKKNSDRKAKHCKMLQKEKIKAILKGRR